MSEFTLLYSIRSQDIRRIKFINRKSIIKKKRNSVLNMGKNTFKIPDLVNINAYANFGNNKFVRFFRFKNNNNTVYVNLLASEI